MTQSVSVPASRAGLQTAALVAGSVTISMALGARATFGLFLDPLDTAGVPLALSAFAIAVHNLVWGLAQPAAGAWADRLGTAPVVATGAALFALGLLLPALWPVGWAVMLGVGLLTGVGTACTGFGVALAGIGRAFPAEKRSGAMGIASAGGSIGQMLLLPVAATALAYGGPRAGFLVLAALLLVVLPLGIPVDRAALVPPARRSSLAAARRALGERAFVLLTLGFFTCGFQLAFLSTHLPGYLSLCGMPASSGAWALMVVGGANIAGSYACGRLGQRLPPQVVLAGLYAIRGAAIFAFYLAPKTDVTVLLFALTMGLTWLGTVPLTSGVIARLFGVADIGTLFGVAFVSHQIGSFLGAWMGGIAYQLYGNYDFAFLATAAAGLVAAAFNLPIRLPRTAAA